MTLRRKWWTWKLLDTACLNGTPVPTDTWTQTIVFTYFARGILNMAAYIAEKGVEEQSKFYRIFALI